MEKTILAVSGKPGLYALISQGSKNSLIVESVDAQKRRFALSPRDRVTAINDVTVYTEAGDEPLTNVFLNIRNKENAAPASIDAAKATEKELRDYMAEILPDYDRDRVYATDIKKIIRWYNLLLEAGITDFETPEAETETAEAE